MTITTVSKILRERAEKLAKPLEEQESLTHSLEILIFTLGEENYGIETKYIVEVNPLKDFTPLPSAPTYVYGLANVRRKILLIIDLKKLFSIPEESNISNKLVILGNVEKSFAILIDNFSGIRKISKDNLQSSLPTLTGIRQEFLKGLTNDGVVILDGQKLLSSQYLIINETIN